MSSSEGENVISSATAIMYRHQKKKRKWYKKIGDHFHKSSKLKEDSLSRELSQSTGNVYRINKGTNVLGKIGTGSLINLNVRDPGHYSDDADTESNCSFELLHSKANGVPMGHTFHRKVGVQTSGSSAHSGHELQGHDLHGIFNDSIRCGSISDASYNSDLSLADFDSIIPSSTRIENPWKSHDWLESASDSDFQENSLRQRRNELMQHSFFHLDVWLKEGVELVARDSSGTSDPYVKFKVGGKQYYKSRTVYKNLNPKWDEKFMIPIEDVTKPVVVKCFDYDRGMSDDPMGSAEINIASLDLNAATEVKLNLAGEKKDEGYMGYLLVQCTLTPKSAQEKERMRKNKKSGKLHQTRSSTLKKPGGSMEGASKKLKQQIWSGVVTIVLVEGTNLMAMDDNGFSDPYVKFRLGQEKYKSKHVSKTLNPRWLEQFDLRIFDDQSKILEITLFDHDISRDDFMGRATMDLSQLGKEMTHEIDKELEDGAGVLKLLLTISGTHSNESVTDLTTYTADPRERDALYKKYGVFNSFKSIKDIGWLQVKVFKAQGLASADIGGKSDPFCVLELCNARLQTQTEYKTLNPEWNKVFTMDIKDVHAILEVTVYDEDRDKKVEFLGKMAIPLLNIKRGERRWYALKDKKLMARAKGAIMLEMDFIYNPVRAAIRTVNPREEKYMQTEQKFKISIMKRNIDRVTKIAESAVEGGKFLNSCFSWESKPRSMTAFLVFIIITLSFELYMLPVSIIIIFIKGYVMKCVQEAFSTESKHDDMMYVDDEDDDDDDDSKDKKPKKQEEKKSVREKFQAAQEVCLQVQEGMDMVASMGERVKNTFNWTVPWLSMLAVIGLSIGVVVLYFVPIRYLILAWGINKFTKKLRAPNAIPNNELMDFLSRIPSDSELVKYRELRPDVPNLFKKKRA